MANIAPSGDTRLIDRNHPDPLYVQLRIILRERIDRKELSVNDKLPSERELVEMYGVSRITVRQAIKDLENLGFLQTRAGKGIYVAEPKPTYEIEIVRSFTETAEANNRKPGCVCFAAPSFRLIWTSPGRSPCHQDRMWSS